MLSRWYEFLELYVDGEVPRIDPGIRAAAPAVFADEFGVPVGFEEDRYQEFSDDQYDEVRAAFEAEPPVRVLFESGAGGEVPGSPEYSFEATYQSWPPPDSGERSFYLDAEGRLADDVPTSEGADTFSNDPESGAVTFFGEDGYQLMAPLWDFDWTRFAEGDAVAYVSAPFDEDVVLGGAGHAELHLRVPDGDADVQVSLSLIDTEGTEWQITSGLLRLSDRAVDEELSDGLRIDRTFAEADAEDMPADRYEVAKVSLPSFAQPFRVGDRLQVRISSPGRDFGAWSFETIGDDGVARDVGRGAELPSRLRIGVLPGIDEVPDLIAPCPSLRGQACRPFEPTSNRPAD